MADCRLRCLSRLVAAASEDRLNIPHANRCDPLPLLISLAGRARYLCCSGQSRSLVKMALDLMGQPAAPTHASRSARTGARFCSP